MGLPMWWKQRSRIGIYKSGGGIDYADKPTHRAREGLRGYVPAEYILPPSNQGGAKQSRRSVKEFQVNGWLRRGKHSYTDLENAQAAIRVDSIFRLLPDDLKHKGEHAHKKKDAAEKQQNLH